MRVTTLTRTYFRDDGRITSISNTRVFAERGSALACIASVVDIHKRANGVRVEERTENGIFRVTIFRPDADNILIRLIECELE